MIKSINAIALFLIIFLFSCKVTEQSTEFSGVNSACAYSFEESSGHTVYDSSGNGATGFLFGTNVTMQQQGKSGYCYDWTLNTTTPYSYIKINTPQSVHNNTTGFSITGWLYFSTIPSGYHAIINKYKNANNYRSFLFRLNSNRRLYFYVYYSTTGQRNTYTGTLTADTWHFFVATFEYVGSTNSKLRIYVDGVQAAASNTARGPMMQSTSDLIIGGELNASDVPGTYRFRAGKLDEFRFYNRVISSTEAAQMYYSQ